jgi:UPF0755 protein
VLVYRFAVSVVDGGSSGPVGRLVTVRIPRGAGIGRIGDLLDAAGVVSNGQAWALRVRISGDGGRLLPGRYRLHRNEHYSSIIAALRAGPPPPPVVRLAIPEGLRATEIARRAARVGISARAYLAAVAAAHPPAGYRATGHERLGLEGFLFPATYDLTRPARARALVAAQLQAFRREVSVVDESYARRHGLTPYDVLIIASLIQRETAYAPDRRKIAAVIYNRLRLDMPLGIDASLQYAVGSWRPLRARDLEIASPYNSRRHRGLPPTPISNPGLAAIEAAAHPANVPYLYYVAIPHDPRLRSYFTTSYAAFLAFQRRHPA